MALIIGSEGEKITVSVKGRHHEKKGAVLLDFVKLPFPQFGQLVQLFFNAKNVDLSYTQK